MLVSILRFRRVLYVVPQKPVKYPKENIRHQVCLSLFNTFYIQELFLENLDIYETMWRNVIQPDRPQMTVRYGA